MKLRKCPKCGRMGLEEDDRTCLWKGCDYTDGSPETDVLDVITTIKGLEALSIHPQITQLYKKAREVLHQAMLWGKREKAKEDV